MERDQLRPLVERVSGSFDPFMDDRMIFNSIWLKDHWIAIVQGRPESDAYRELHKWAWRHVVAPHIKCDPGLTYEDAAQLLITWNELFEATGYYPTTERLRDELNTDRDDELSISQVEDMLRMFPVDELNTTYFQQVKRRHNLPDDPF